MTDLASSQDQLRPLMFSIAYRMLGQVSEAEDIVQEAWLRMRGTNDVHSPEAFATTVTTRLAIDHLRSARARREAYVGSWLPEPLLTTGDESDPAVRAEVTDTLSMAFLVLLETLSPVERAVFLLRDVFGYDFDEIAPIVDKSEQNCRQILVRARARVVERRPRFESSRSQRDELARRFFAASADGDLAALERMLAADVAFYGDGGGKAPAVRRPVRGRTQVARFVLGLVRQAASLGVRLQPTEVNGQPGALSFDRKGRLVSVLSLDIADGQVWALRNVLNPDKLGHLAMLSPMPPD
ncbi:MAG TPA: RNA polymerase sigma-70 factor [Jiangellaceae bacterium]|nr:RNA polymerase sigma-70 factor [Jiangellaceae bacterium]